jgi:F-type H+-transporting ATPase subunit gamma
MAKTREIKKRIKAVGNIRRITKTMQMIATSKFARAQQASVAGRPYSDTLFDLVTQLSATLGSEISHPLLATPEAGKDLTLILTSDRGLCGPYNGSILRQSMGLFRTTPSTKEGYIELVGKKGLSFLKFSNIPVSQHHAEFGDKPTYEQVRELAESYMKRFLSGDVATVRVVYMKYLSAARQVPTVMQLLPFKAEVPKNATASQAAPATASVYEFSPSAEDLLDDLLPAAVKALLFQAFKDAIVSEHVARMVAMKAATDNAGKMGKLYTRKYNRARQAQITTELTEIISGAAALA